ncbi:MAG: beta-ketoacyl-ACP reductase, partial [Alphaproteobacteria bacterium]|nr:beta-ketoacyl-ACP reductase [Alphaproteobacteria bacterium]
MINMEDKVILLTGATGSLGSAIAKKLSLAGARIALSGTNEDKLNS